MPQLAGVNFGMSLRLLFFFNLAWSSMRFSSKLPEAAHVRIFLIILVTIAEFRSKGRIVWVGAAPPDEKMLLRSFFANNSLIFSISSFVKPFLMFMEGLLSLPCFVCFFSTS